MVKKYLLALLVLLGTTFSFTLFAHDVVVEVNEVKETGNSHGGGARSNVPSVSAFLSESELTINVDKYLGDAIVCIYNSNYEVANEESAYVNDHSEFSIDLSSLSSGSFLLRIVLNGIEYEGNFEL